MTLPTIGPRGGAGDSGATKEPVTNQQVLNVVAFILVVLPTAVAINVFLWAAAFWLGRN